MTTVNVVDETADPIVIEVFTGAPGPQGPKGDKGDQGPAGASGANGAMALIANSVVVTDGDNGPTWNAIPQTFHDLVISYSAIGNAGGYGSIVARFNGDAAAGQYDSAKIIALSPNNGWVTSTGGSDSVINLASIMELGGSGIVTIPQYRAGVPIPKRAILGDAISYRADGRFEFGTYRGFWKSGAPITSIQLLANFGGGFQAGSVFTLYGR